MSAHLVKSGGQDGGAVAVAMTPAECHAALGYFMQATYRFRFTLRELSVLGLVARKSFFLGRPWTRPLTQGQIAALLGMAKSHVSEVLKGTSAKDREWSGLVGKQVVRVSPEGCYAILMDTAFWRVSPALSLTPELVELEVWSDQERPELAPWFGEPSVVDELVPQSLKNLPTRGVDQKHESAVRPSETRSSPCTGREPEGGVASRESAGSQSKQQQHSLMPGAGPAIRGQPQLEGAARAAGCQKSPPDAIGQAAQMRNRSSPIGNFGVPHCPDGEPEFPNRELKVPQSGTFSDHDHDHAQKDHARNSMQHGTMLHAAAEQEEGELLGGQTFEVGAVTRRSGAEILAELKRAAPNLDPQREREWIRRIGEDARLCWALACEARQRHDLRNPAGWMNSGYMREHCLGRYKLQL